jgi:hypothetical protein
VRPRPWRAVLADGGEGGAEGAADVVRVAEAAEGIGEDGVVESDAASVSGAQYGESPVGQAEEPLAGSGLGGLADQALALDADDGVGDLDDAASRST